MKSIKFRIWDKRDKCFNISTPSILTDYKRKTLSIKSNKYLVVQEYTGLKDCKGKEIYEGDILEHTARNHCYAPYIVEKCGLFWFKCNDNFIIASEQEIRKMKIVGNIMTKKLST